MDLLDELGSLKRKPAGQKKCPKCGRQYNNNAIPVNCLDPGCKSFLGGSFKQKNKEEEALMLTNSVCSVRQNVSGVAKRVFVDLLEEKCSNVPCMEAKGSLRGDQRTVNFCPHIKKAREAFDAKIFAKVETLNLQEVLQKVSDDELEESLKKESTDDEITIFILPGGVVAVPILNSDFSGCENTQFVHVKDSKCTLESCSKSKPRKHTLVVKGPNLCPHSLLYHLRDQQPVKAADKDSEHFIDFKQTVKDVISKVKKGFPSSFKECEDSDFLLKSRNFVDSLIAMPAKLDEVLKVVPSICEYCDCSLTEWNFKDTLQYSELV